MRLLYHIKIYILLVSLPIGITARAQQQTLLEQGYEFVGVNPDEAIKIGEHLLKRDITQKEKCEAYFLMAQGYYTKGIYDNALKNIFEAGKNIENLPSDLQIKILLFKTKLTRELHLNRQSEKYFVQAGEIVKSTTDSTSLFEVYLMIEKTQRAIQRNEFKQALILSDSIFNSYKNFNDKPQLYQQWCIDRAEIYKGISSKDSVIQYYKKMLDSEKQANSLKNKSIALNELSRIYFAEKQYSKSLELLLQAQEAAQKIDDSFLLLNIKSQMISIYLILNNKEQQNGAHGESMVLKTKTQNLEKSAVNTAYNLISQEEEENYNFQQNISSKNIKISVVIFIIIAIATLVFFIKNSMRLKSRNEIIKYLEISNNIWNQKKKNPQKSDVSKKINIPAETEQLILAKLKRFESSVKFTNKEMSLALLASQFDTNTKYLSEIINTHYNENFNSYINRLRVGFIINKIKSDPNYLNYKISYLADQCGFSSHSSFATVFKSVTGIAPTTFIELMQEEKNKQEQINETLL